MLKYISIFLSVAIISQSAGFIAPAFAEQPVNQADQQLAQEQRAKEYSETLKALTIREKDPFVYNGAFLKIEVNGKPPVTLRVNNKGTIDIPDYGEYKIAGKRISQAQKELFQALSYEFKIELGDPRPPVAVLGAVVQQGLVGPDELSKVIASVGGLDVMRSNLEISIFEPMSTDPEKGRVKVYNYMDIVEGREIVWVNPGATVNARYRSGVYADSISGPWFRIIGYILGFVATGIAGYALGTSSK